MTSPNDTTWYEENRHYLMAAVRAVAEELESYAEKSKVILGKTGFFPTEKNFSGEMTSTGFTDMMAPPALETIAGVFKLTTFERKLLLMCAGVELDSKFASLIASLHGNPNQFLPSFGMALSIFPDAHWDAITPASPLRYWQLIEINPEKLLTTSPLKIDERILHYLTGISSPDERLTGIVEECPDGIELVDSHRRKADQILKYLLNSSENGILPVIQLSGDDIPDIMEIAASVSSGLGLDLRKVSVRSLPVLKPEITAMVRLCNREIVLSGFAFFLDCSGTETGDTVRIQAITEFCENIRGVLFIGSGKWKPDLLRPSIVVDVHKPTLTEQVNQWKTSLGNDLLKINGELGKIASQFNLSARAIHTISAEISMQHSPDETTEEERFTQLLWETCCAHSRPRLNELAQRIDPVAHWDDLILPEFQKSLLHEISMHVKQRSRVYQDWGFGIKNNRGLGITALFAGESGTGKTMASEVLANDLKLDLYRIDLSQVVNKYIGETEKNLRKIFDAAEDGGAILLFDEADALFGKRSEVKDSHDRYANIEVSYLLQRMEAYRGLAILTTNMKSALDRAFLRRIRFIIQFPFPDLKQRAEIWRKIFPAEMPKDSLNWEKLARLNIAGGNIHNIALYAAFLAANENKPVSMNHISVAARSEYAKLEKQMSSGEMIL